MQTALAHLSLEARAQDRARAVRVTGDRGAPGLAWSGDQGLFCLPDALIQLTAGTKGGGPWALDKPAAGKPVRMFSIKCFLGDWKKKKKKRSQKNFSAEVNLFSAIKRSTG